MKHGLSEDEAYEIEKSYIEQYGLKIKNEGKLINLDEGGFGISSEVSKRNWEKRKEDVEAFEIYKEEFKNKMSVPKIKERNIAARRANKPYMESLAQRMKSYSADPQKMQKAVETRNQNPNWKKSVIKARKEYFKNAKNLEKHRKLMQSEAYKEKHLEGMKKHHKKTRILFLDENDNVIGYEDFESRTVLCEKYSLNKGKVTEVIKGTRRKHMGYKFTDIDENSPAPNLFKSDSKKKFLQIEFDFSKDD